jgi:arylsulfatase A-like enzyme
VVLISIDSLRADHLTCYGYARDTSPNLDQLAREGVLFQNHISSSSWTLPAHASLFTSLPDSLHGCVDTDRMLSSSATTLAERFAAAGYETAGFFSGPFLHPVFGLGQGFERYEDCTSYAAMTASGPPSTWVNDGHLNEAAHRDITGPRVFEAVSRWFGARTRKPFFLFIHLWDVHFDYIPPPPFDTKYDADYHGKITGKGFLFDPRIKLGMPARDLQHLIALYDGEIAWTDTFLGKLRDLLARDGRLEDTILAVTADHGTEFFEHGHKAHRQTLFDEVIRVPLVLRFPRRLPRSLAIAAQTRSIDVGPTLLDLAGLSPPTDVVGTTLLPLIASPLDVKIGRAVSELCTDGRNQRSVRTRQWKFIDDRAIDSHYFLDLENDPREAVPRGDFASGLGRMAEDGYLGEVRALESFAESHPVPAADPSGRSRIPPAVLEDLKRLGYVGGADDGTATRSKR